MGTDTTQPEKWSFGPASVAAIAAIVGIPLLVYGLVKDKQKSDLEALRFSYKVVWDEGSLVFEGPSPDEAMLEKVVIAPYFGRGNTPMQPGDVIPLTRDTVSRTDDGRYHQIKSIDDVVCKASDSNFKLCKSRGLSELLVTFEVFGTRDTDRVEIEQNNSRG